MPARGSYPAFSRFNGVLERTEDLVDVATLRESYRQLDSCSYVPVHARRVRAPVRARRREKRYL
jgi:hypothetical protein